MPDALPQDSGLSFPHLTVVSASAGSGKTTTLTKRYVQFLLSDRVQHRKPRHLLAITFTNNAATEMKQRILSTLKRLALGDKDSLKEFAQSVGAGPETVQARAKLVLETILDGYSEFQVRTIDSFLAAVFRSTAIDLGYSPSVELQLHPERLIRQSLRTFSRLVAQETKTMDLIRHLLEQADEGRPDRSTYLWDPYARIADKVLDLYLEVASLGVNIVLPDMTAEIQRLSTLAMKQGAELRELVETSGLPPYKHFMTDLDLVAAGDVRSVIDRTPKTKATNKAATKEQKAAESTFGNRIADLLDAFNATLGKLALLEARSYFVPYAKTLVLMEALLKETKRKENVIFLDDVTSALRTYLDASVVPEMYIKLGDRIHHFLIDEFQDTSPSQWKAISPLLENSLSERGSLFVVGDMKQSIYSFRGADWKIMRRLMDEKVFPSAPPRIQTLGTNYRSRPALLEMTRDVFHTHVPKSDFKEAAEATGLSTYELSPEEKAEGGHVEVVHIPRDPETSPENEEIVKLVRDAHRRGHPWGDIAVLTPTNASVIDISSTLNEQDIPFVSQSSLDIRNRKVVRELLACLRFLDSPVDDTAFATFILGDVMRAAEPQLDPVAVRRAFLQHREAGDDRPLYKRFQDDWGELWERRVAELFQNIGFLPLYDLVSALVGVFEAFGNFPKERASLVRFLDCVREFEAEGNNAVRDFVKEAGEDGGGISWELPRPAGQDAVTLMTIHKAKGLGFQVVIVLLREWRKRGGRPALLESDSGVELVRIGSGDARNEVLRKLKDQTSLNYQADELNKLYVALTRARSEMYVLTVTDAGEKPPACFLLPSTTGGKRPKIDRPASAEAASAEAGFATRKRLQTEGTVSGLKDREIRRGDMVHAALQYLSTVRDLDDDVRIAVERALPGQAGETIDALSRTLKQFLSATDVRELFMEKKGRSVYCEYEVVDDGGMLNRIDRLVIDAETVLVIDFKTGGRELEEKYKEQISGYMKICRSLFPDRKIHGRIAYVDMKLMVGVE